MNRNDKEDASDTDDSAAPGQLNSSSRAKDRLPAPREKETIITNSDAGVLSRESAAAARGDAAYLREKAAALREVAAALREVATSLREGMARARKGEAPAAEETVATGEQGQVIPMTADTVEAACADQLTMLRQANAQLLISALEAHKLAEQIETSKAQLHHLAHHDILTGLPNRMLLQDRLGQSIELARRQGTQLAVLFMDLDRFKHINDSLGHSVGDQLLRSVAQRIEDCVRHSDTVSRQGGDEFVVLLSNIKHPEDAAVSAQKILDALTASHFIDQLELSISASIGISTYPDDGLDVKTLLKSADSAMYHAKENGRNNYKFFEPEMNVRAVQRQSVEAGLRRALERRQFMLHYQPKIDLHSNRIVGVEALLRWQHPEWGLTLPSEFIPIAEDCGLILPIGRWALREACLQVQRWRQAGMPPVTVAVNTSALEFGDKDFLENIRAILKDTGLEPRYLELELTERVLMRDAEFTNQVLHALTDMGIKLVIDDFGTGYSSLSYLRQFPISTLKIDPSFVNRMISNRDHATIVSAVISLGKSLKLRVSAAGVETPEQHAFLMAQHCDEAQGYYFCHPMMAEIFATLLQTDIAQTPLHLKEDRSASDYTQV